MGKRRKKIMTVFDNYKLRSEERDLVLEYEQYTRCDLMSADEVTDVNTFRANLVMNMNWYRDNVQETMDMLDRDLDEYHIRATDREYKIKQVLKG